MTDQSTKTGNQDFVGRVLRAVVTLQFGALRTPYVTTFTTEAHGKRQSIVD